VGQVIEAESRDVFAISHCKNFWVHLLLQAENVKIKFSTVGWNLLESTCCTVDRCRIFRIDTEFWARFWFCFRVCRLCFLACPES
jgi:hypothetical protein